MITASRIAACRGIEDVAGLFASLGYPVDLQPLDPGVWREAGFDLQAGEEASFYHLSRVGAVDLIGVVDGTFRLDAAADLLARFRARNPLRKQVLLHLKDGCLTLVDLAAGRRVRRLQVALPHPRPEVVDRLNLLERRGGEAAIAPLFDRAFDREPVTRQFFRRFRDARAALAQAMASAAPREAEEEVLAQALLVLSRILFLYFVQEKGWLNGERRFLVDRLEACERRGAAFFSEVLQPLFFGCLNTPPAARTEASRDLGRIPYLNGGLFEPSPFERRRPETAIGNPIMRDVLEGVFERFSFSVEESGEDVTSVDPEMLGKVFESLMRDDERLASGSFYTPREIVEVLTGRAIALACGGMAESPESLAPDEARSALRRVEGLRVLDPACGSGAFLLAALRALEDLTRRLSARAGVTPDPALRRRLVERCLFGVDLKPEAVRLCELRLWLAIVSTESGPIEHLPPLPNLDRNILQGNSLLSPVDFLGGGRAEIYGAWASAIRERAEQTDRYRHAEPSEKPALARRIRESDCAIASALLDRGIAADRGEIRALRGQRSLLAGPRRVSEEEIFLRARIARWRAARKKVARGELDFFSYDVHFAQVMASGGFDVVLGNPPWVRSSRIDAAARRMYADRYRCFRGAGPGFRQSDLAIAFFERGLELARPGGVLAFLMPGKVLTARYAAPLRASILAEHELVSIDDWTGERRRLFDGDTFPLGVTVRRERGGASRRPVVVSGPLSLWSIIPEDLRPLAARLHERFEPLAVAIGRAPLMGVKTGANDRFFLWPAEPVPGGVRIRGIDVPPEALCRCIRGRHVRRWSAGASEWMLWPPQNGWPASLPWVRRLTAETGIDISALRLAYVRPEHLGTKVIWKDVSKGLQAAVVSDTCEAGGARYPLVPNQTVYFIDTADIEEAYVLAALLNSSPFNALALTVAEPAKDAHFRYFGVTIGGIPAPRLERGGEAWRALARLARRAHAGQDVGMELDRVVASLYGMKAEDAALLENFLRARLRLS